jgi:pyridoxal/pyridoxine/pyridoxamine kinase
LTNKKDAFFQGTLTTSFFPLKNQKIYVMCDNIELHIWNNMYFNTVSLSSHLSVPTTYPNARYKIQIHQLYNSLSTSTVSVCWGLLGRAYTSSLSGAVGSCG